MHAHGRRLSFARLMAPLALIASIVAVVALVMGSGVVSDDSSSTADTKELTAPTDTSTKTTPGTDKQIPRRYTIKANDTLSGIAAKMGTTVERLQELNPELDPQGLVAGQKIKLRE